MKRLFLISVAALLMATSASAQSSGPGMGFFGGGGFGNTSGWCQVYNCKAYQASMPARIREGCAKGNPVLHDMGSCATSARKSKRVKR